MSREDVCAYSWCRQRRDAHEGLAHGFAARAEAPQGETSRSVQRRLAAQKGESAPTFAAQPETGGDEARAFVTASETIEEFARGLVENAEWDYNGAREVEKEYYRRFARKCLLRIEPLVSKLLAAGRAAENEACETWLRHIAETDDSESRWTKATIASVFADAIAARRGSGT